ncbi:MAG: ChbG/HpnK family deacetylase [Lachnospiraceae bacterium]|nr:ChbG/HpnK family deacetylase [Lachnospiraceae bacterium]
MIRLIINADDLGLSDDVNRAIAECFADGSITGTTLMVNMDHADEAVDMAERNGWSGQVGLHLNLTSGRPLTEEIKQYESFCDKDGCFNAAFAKGLLSRLYLSKREIEAAGKEAEAQIKKYLSYGLTDRHLDSHHHVHTDPSLWKAVQPLLNVYDIRSVRLTRNLYQNMSFAKRIYKNLYNERLKALKIQTTDYFGSFKDFRCCRDRIRDGSLVEMMIHPMHGEDGRLMDTDIPMDEEREFLSGVEHTKEHY